MGMTVLNLNQPPQRDPLKILLVLLVDEVGFEDSPALHDLGERDGALGLEVQVEGSAHGEVGHEFEVADGEGAELEGADGVAVDWGWAAEGAEVGGLYGARRTHRTHRFRLRGR